MPNLTDEALLLFRTLRWSLDPRAARLCYRAYLRWRRRAAQQAGTIQPSSLAARHFQRQAHDA